MRAIPKSLLIHSARLLKKMKEDEWGEAKLSVGTALRCIRMEPSSKIVRDKNNSEVQLAATMFYDCRNSKPRYISFVVDDIIVFNGQKFQIKVVEPLYDNRSLHHYELGLIMYG